jgi:hypothetical protein
MNENFEPLTDDEGLAFSILQHPEAPLAMMRAQLDGRDVAVVGVVQQQGIEEDTVFTPIAMLVNIGDGYGRELYDRMVPLDGAQTLTHDDREFLDFAESQFEGDDTPSWN